MNEKMNDALNEISDRHIDEAATYKKRRNPWWFAAVAAVLAVIIAFAAIAGRNPYDPNIPTTPHLQATLPSASGIAPPENLVLANLVAQPVYPKMLKKPNLDNYDDYMTYDSDYAAWLESVKKQYDQPDGYANGLTSFFAASMQEFLQGEENKAYSPLNVYLALAMLAETTAGNSQQQILNLLGSDSIEKLREQASHVWNAHYRDDGETSLLFANSLWLDDAYQFEQNTVSLLASQYYASVFHGDLGAESINQQLRQWLNANTGGLLQEQAENVELDPETVFALASTAYFTAGWADKFNENKTRNEVFHGLNGDVKTAFMHQTYSSHFYFRGTHFGAICLGLTGGNTMWLILPDEGHNVNEILESGEYLELTLNSSEWKNSQIYEINLSLPKFDIAHQQDLAAGIQKYR